MITLLHAHVEEMYAHAREANPHECCGLIGGDKTYASLTIYRLRNVAENPLTLYEAAHDELFRAQRDMRRRGEQLMGIYHSHPRSDDPAPSETDVRLAYYPDAIYFIIGLLGPVPSLRAFQIAVGEGTWRAVPFSIAL